MRPWLPFFLTCPSVRRAARVGWRKRAAFTAVELLVATVVMALVVLGVYTVFRQALVNEKTISARWRDRQGAVVVADYLAESIENGASLAEVPAVRGGPVDGGEGFELVCLVGGGPSGSGAAERRRFWWGLAEEPGRLFQQTLVMAGAAELTSPGSPGETLNDTQRWSLAPAEPVAEAIAELAVTYRPLDNADAPWKKAWSGEAPALVRVVVRVGEERVERFVTWHTRGPLVAGDGGGAP